jgi:hypothetical protein
MKAGRARLLGWRDLRIRRRLKVVGKGGALNRVEWFLCFLDAARAPAPDRPSGPAADRAEWLSIFLMASSQASGPAVSSEAVRVEVARSSSQDAVESRVEEVAEQERMVARAEDRREEQREEQAHMYLHGKVEE